MPQNDLNGVVQRADCFDSGKVAVAHLQKEGLQSKVKNGVENISKVVTVVQDRTIPLSSHLGKQPND